VLFGARVDQLPLIWTRLVDAGFESGHAYGKSLRTVKSCEPHSRTASSRGAGPCRAAGRTSPTNSGA
ncbi:hypothetical protein DLE01_36650, partial [Streptomyces sp. FT05W]